jgi:hypothetical protein
MQAARRTGEPLTFGLVPSAIPAYLATRGFEVEDSYRKSSPGPDPTPP